MNQDLKKLQGTWNLVALEVDGQQLAPGGSTDGRIVLAGDQFEVTGMGGDYAGRVKIDTKANPKTLDLIFEAGPEAGNTNFGIYRLDSDTWTICLATRGTTRPGEFATSPGTGLALETFKREREAAGKARARSAASAPTAPAPAGAAPADSVAQDVPEFQAGPTELEGEWAMVSGIMNGQPMDPNGVKYGKRITRGNDTSVLFGPQVYFKARVVIDATKAPKTIDYFYTEGPSRGQAQYGIYELDPNSVTICVAGTGKDRPNDFTTKPGDGKTLTVWKLSKR